MNKISMFQNQFLAKITFRNENKRLIYYYFFKNFGQHTKIRTTLQSDVLFSTEKIQAFFL